jgi:protein SHQ1
VEVVVTEDEEDGGGGGGSVLHFCSPPYLLVLNLSPHRLADGADEECAEHRPESAASTLVLRLAKGTPGERWEDLHLVGRFLLPRRRKEPAATARWLQEIVSESPGPVALIEDGAEERTDAAGTAIEDAAASVLAAPPLGAEGAGGYGFAHMFRDVLHQDWSRDDMAKEMLEGFSHYWEGANGGSSDDDGGPVSSRRVLRATRERVEGERFSPERYLQDLDVEDDYVYQCAVTFEPHWRAGAPCDDSGAFTPEERRQLASVPYPLLPAAVTEKCDGDTDGDDASRSRRRRTLQLAVGLVDLLFAYAYDHLTTAGEPTVESAWTVATLSCSLSWLDDPWTDDGSADVMSESKEGDNEISAASWLKQSIRSSLRRAVVYPYIRSLDFGVLCARQVAEILESGPVCVIRCLLQARAILHRSDLYYLSNKLYLDPYLAWLQLPQTSRELGELSSWLARQLRACLATSDWKTEAGLNLLQLESTPLSSASCDGTEDEDDASNVSSDSSSGSDATEDSSEDSSCGRGSDSDASANELDHSTTVRADDCSARLEREVLGTMKALSLSSGARSNGESNMDNTDLQLDSFPLRPKGPLIQELD